MEVCLAETNQTTAISQGRKIPTLNSWLVLVRHCARMYVLFSDGLRSASGTTEKAWPPLDDYRSLVRGYVPHHLHKPSWWSECPFAVVEVGLTHIECTRPHIDFSQDRPYSLHDRFRSRDSPDMSGITGTAPEPQTAGNTAS